jgi:AcrR family transcriptional regulator
MTFASPDDCTKHLPFGKRAPTVPPYEIGPHRRRAQHVTAPARMSGAQLKPRSRRNNESNRRDELLRVSARLFREKGFDGTTIRDISGAAGMHSGSPFYHFKTKQDILVAVMEQGLAEGLSRLQEAAAAPGSARQRFVRMVRAQIGTILEDGQDFIPVLLYEWRALTRGNQRRIVALNDRYDALWQPVIDELKRDGHLPGDARLVRLLIMGAVNWTGRWYRPGGRFSLDEIAESTARLFLHQGNT